MALLKESLNFLNFLPSHTRGQRFLAFTRPPDFWRCQVGTSAIVKYPQIVIGKHIIQQVTSKKILGVIILMNS